MVTEVTDSCAWVEDGEGGWTTGCSGRFEISEGTPAQNNMKFCCYCGKTIGQGGVSLEHTTPQLREAALNNGDKYGIFNT